ncbi:DUF2478 domain-containing protein [Comamonas sp. F1-6]
MITAVAARHEAGWQSFTGGAFVRLPVDEQALLHWCRQQLAREDREDLAC